MGKFLAFALLLLVALSGLLALTQQQSSTDKNNISEPVRSAKNNQDQSSTTYNIARTSNGSLTKTIELNLGIINKHQIARVFPASQVKELKPNQRVLLKDKSNALITSYGLVSSIDHKENDIKVEIQLPKDIALETISSQAKVIIFQSRVSHRLPYSAMQFDKEDQAFVWVAEKTDNERYKVIKTPLSKIYEGDHFFDPNIRNKAYMHFVLTPDEHMEDGASYDFKEVKVQAPLRDPLKQAKFEKHIKKLKEKNAVIGNRQAACREAKANKKSNVEISSSCTSSIGDKKPMDIINDLLKKR